MTRSRLFLYFFIITCASTGLYVSAGELEELIIRSILEGSEVRFSVDVPESDKVVTGIDVDKLMRRYIDDYDQYDGSMMVSPDSLIYRWVYYHVPSDTKRTFRLDIGVYKSHKEAVKRGIITYTTVQSGFDYENRDGIYFTLIKPSHCCVALKPDRYVKNNVYIGFNVYSAPYDEKAILTSILIDIDNGAEGVTIGNKVDIPTIDDSALPDEITFESNETLSFPIKVTDPNSRKYMFYIYGRGYDNFHLYEFPYHSVHFPYKWDPSNGLQIQCNEPMNLALFEGGAFNDLNVFSDRWERKIKINAPEDSAVSHFSSM